VRRAVSWAFRAPFVPFFGAPFLHSSLPPLFSPCPSFHVPLLPTPPQPSPDVGFCPLHSRVSGADTASLPPPAATFYRPTPSATAADSGFCFPPRSPPPLCELSRQPPARWPLDLGLSRPLSVRSTSLTARILPLFAQPPRVPFLPLPFAHFCAPPPLLPSRPFFLCALTTG